MSSLSKNNNLRLNIQLRPTTENYYNIVNYRTVVEDIKGKENIEFYGLKNFHPLAWGVKEFDDYIEDTFIDNSEDLRDSYPPGMQPVLEGFFINKGKLKLKTIADIEKKDQVEKIESNWDVTRRLEKKRLRKLKLKPCIEKQTDSCRERSQKLERGVSCKKEPPKQVENVDGNSLNSLLIQERRIPLVSIPKKLRLGF